MKKAPKTLAPVRASAGLKVAYEERLADLISEMNRSVRYWVRAAYRARRPEITRLAADASPARDLASTVSRLSRRWQSRFDDLAADLGRWFARKAADRSDVVLHATLKRGGFAVEFRPTRAQNDAFQAIVAENVELIRSIPQRYLADVQGHVMRSVQAGRDLGSLTAEIESSYGIARRRAALIARDQNNKATAVFTRVRHQELGITHARWVHSSAGKTPRPSHVKAGREGVIYPVAEGWYDPDVKRKIWPGELINCRCIARAIIPGTEKAA